MNGFGGDSIEKNIDKSDLFLPQLEFTTGGKITKLENEEKRPIEKKQGQ